MTKSPLHWNDPRSTWKLGSYQPPKERRVETDRRDDARRAAIGDRRTSPRRALRSLFKL